MQNSDARILVKKYTEIYVAQSSESKISSKF